MHSPRILSLPPISLATDVTDATLGASALWLGTRIGAGGTATLTKSFFFWPQPMAPWTTGLEHTLPYFKGELLHRFFNILSTAERQI